MKSPDHIRHCMVAWGSQSSLTVSDELQTQLVAALSGHAFARAFEQCYVVTLTYDAERYDLLEKLRSAIKTYEAEHEHTDVGVLVSPPLAPGSAYNGWLPLETWDEINRRSMVVGADREDRGDQRAVEEAPTSEAV